MNNSQICRDHKILKDKKNISLIMRHAEKVSNDIGDDKSKSISPDGQIEAEKLGKTLDDFNYNVTFFKSSPFKRCIDTCMAIKKGGNFNANIIYSNNLGDPGPFVIDDKLAVNYFSKYSAKRFVNLQLAGHYFPGIREVKEGVELLSNELLDDMRDYSGFGIYITHDAILVPFVSYLTGVPFDKNNWFDFLEGIYLFLGNDQISMLWNGKIINLNK